MTPNPVNRPGKSRARLFMAPIDTPLDEALQEKYELLPPFDGALLKATGGEEPVDVFDRWAAGELDPTPEPPRNQYEAASRINDPKRWQQ